MTILTANSYFSPVLNSLHIGQNTEVQRLTLVSSFLSLSLLGQLSLNQISVQKKVQVKNLTVNDFDEDSLSKAG